MSLNARKNLIERIIEKLNADLELFFNAAKNAHEAATHEENQPDNKYDTLALEASYVAQGQANRAQELRHSIEIFQRLELPTATDVIQLATLVTLETDSGDSKQVFIGPSAGGLRISTEDGDVMVITPASPLGKSLLGKSVDDIVEIVSGANITQYHIVEIQ